MTRNRCTNFETALLLAGCVAACSPLGPPTPDAPTVSMSEPTAPSSPTAPVTSATGIAALSCDDIKTVIEYRPGQDGIRHAIPGSGTDYGEDYFTRHMMPNAHFCWAAEFDFDGGGSEEYSCQWPQPDHATAIAVAEQIAAKIDACLPELKAFTANQAPRKLPLPPGHWRRALSAADDGKSVGVFVTDDAYKSAYPSPANAEGEPGEGEASSVHEPSPKLPAAPPGPFVRFHVFDELTTCEAFGWALKSAVRALREPPKPGDPRGVDGNRAFLSPFDFDSVWPNEIGPYLACFEGWRRQTLTRAEFNPSAEFMSGIELIGAVDGAPLVVRLYEQSLEHDGKVVWLEVQLR